MSARISPGQALLPGQQPVEQAPSDEEEFRKKETAMARISIYIVIWFGFCHSIRFILDTYDIVYTDIELPLGHEV